MPLLSHFYDCGEPLQGISLNASQEYGVVATKTHLQTYQLLPNLQLLHQYHLVCDGGGNYKLTDVTWNQYDNDKIATSTTNGMIAVFNINQTIGRGGGGNGNANSASTPKSMRQEWDCGEMSRAVNRISWHHSDKYHLLSAHQDGQIKIWDTLRQKNSCIKVISGYTDACRDAKFDPFHPNLIAAIYESGILMIWDRRNPDHAVARISAHAESGLTLEWSPNAEGLLATGSRDKTVKIWDIKGLDENTEGERSLSSNTVRPMHVIHTPAPLESIAWRPSGGESTHSKRLFQIATTSSNESGRGDINVWDATNPNIPACVLRGHTDGCTGFQWVDTPPFGSNVYQHIVSVGKDNKILVQDLRNGYFPSQHMSGHVVAVSAMGYVAFQRGNVYRGDPLGLYTNELTASAPSYFQDDPAAFGIPSKYLQTEPPNLVRNRLSTSPGDGVTATSISTQPSAPLRSFDSGAIVVGMASINNIIESIECISGYSAEGGAYDPIVIKELAQRYITSQSEIPPGSSPSPVAITSTGLHHCNISPPVRPEWGYETFVPSCAPGYDDSTPILSELFPSSIPLSRSVHEAVNACQWNCLVAKSVGLAGHSMIWNALMSLIPVLMISAESHSTSSQGFTSTLPETSSLNYAMETLCELLVELIDCGDCQHFVICCEILRNVDIHFTTHDHIPHHDDDHSHRPEPASSSHYVPSQSMPPSSEMAKKSLWKSLQQTIGELRIREGYVAYLELLFKLGLYQLSNAIIVRSTDKYITQLSQQGVIIRSSCAQCSKEINVDTTGGSTSSAASSSNSTASSSSTSNSSRMMSIWCLKCHKCVDLCSLCQQPVKGLLKWCQICGHGGHPQCIFKWFSQHEVCPTGCGHKCQPNGQCSEVIGNSSGNASGGCLLKK